MFPSVLVYFQFCLFENLSGIMSYLKAFFDSFKEKNLTKITIRSNYSPGKTEGLFDIFRHGGVCMCLKGAVEITFS